MKTILFTLSLLLFSATLAFSQQDHATIIEGQYVEIELNDGTEIIGEVIAVTASDFVISTASLGQLNVSKFQIKRFSIIDQNQIQDDGTVYFDNPIPTRNYITETAIGLKKGETFYQNILLGAHTFSTGLSDRFSLSGGFETFSLFAGNTPIVFLAPKFTFPNKKENLHFGIGGNLAIISSIGDGEVAGTLYGITTFGGVNNNITVGVGFAYAGDGFSDIPLIQIGGMKRLGKHFMLVGDNILVSDANNVFVAGTWTLRFITKKIGVDIGLATTYEDAAIPVLGVCIRF